MQVSRESIGKLLGINAVLRLLYSAQVARSRGAHGRLFASPLLFSSHAKHSEAAVKKSRSIVKTTGRYFCQQDSCARNEQKTQLC